MYEIIAIVAAIIITLLIIVFVVFHFVDKSKGAAASQMSASAMMLANGTYYDPSLQYNITNHPVRNQMLAEAAVNPPSPPKKEDIDAMRKQLNDWYNGAQAAGKLKSMDYWGKISIDAALDSASMGNFPIGNVLCYMPEGTENDPSKWIELLRGGNRFFTRNQQDILAITNFVPRMDSGAHGEMVILNAFEDRLTRGLYDKTNPNYSLPRNSPVDFRKRNDIVGFGMPNNIILFTQLNSCEMCLSRIGNSGISRCYWIAADSGGGMGFRLCNMAPAYFAMLNRQVHDVADVSLEMIQFAEAAFMGPAASWIIYCTWKLGQVGASKNLTADYGYCKGQYYANDKVGQNTAYDAAGFFRTVDLSHGPYISVKPPSS